MGFLHTVYILSGVYLPERKQANYIGYEGSSWDAVSIVVKERHLLRP